MSLSIILHPILRLFIAILIGFISAKTGFLKENTRQGISKLIVNITLPLMILTSLLSKELTGDTVGYSLITAGTAFVAIVTLFVLGILTAKAFKLHEPTKTLHSVLSGTGNVGFLGYPLIGAVFGADAKFYAIIFGMVNDLLFWTLGVYLINKTGTKNLDNKPYKKLLNPNTIALLVGLAMLFLKIKIPPILNETLSGIGDTTVYLSMIFIGMTLATVNIKHIYKRVTMLAPVILKMILMPIFTAWLFSRFDISPLVTGAIVFQIAMPAQTVISIIALEAGSDEQYAAEYIFLSTALSLITLPFVYFVMERL